MVGMRVEMSRIYREMESGKRDSQDGSRLVYVLTQTAKVLELTEIGCRGLSDDDPISVLVVTYR
jgi:hypothetical protein